MGTNKVKDFAEDSDRRLVGYMDALRGDFMSPQSAKEGTLFQSLFAFTTAIAMILSINTIGNQEPIIEALKMLGTLPIWFCIAFTMRSLFANDLSFWLYGKFIAPRVTGVAASALFVLINVIIMAPIMCAFGTGFGVIMGGADWSQYPAMYLEMLPKAALIAWLLVFFVARPIVGIVFSDVFKPLLGKMRRNRTSKARATKATKGTKSTKGARSAKSAADAA